MSWPSGLRGFSLIKQPDAQWLESMTNVFFFIFFSCLCHFLCQFQTMYKYEKFYQNILHGSRVMTIFTKRFQPAKKMFGIASLPFCIPVAGQC